MKLTRSDMGWLLDLISTLAAKPLTRRRVAWKMPPDVAKKDAREYQEYIQATCNEACASVSLTLADAAIGSTDGTAEVKLSRTQREFLQAIGKPVIEKMPRPVYLLIYHEGE